MSSKRPPFEHVLVGLVVVTVCLSMLGPILSQLLPVLVVLGVLAIALRLTFFHTRRW